MLSRVAEAIYWMRRYAERAENVARFVEVNFYLTLDLPGAGDQWMPLISVTGDETLFLDQYEEAGRDEVLEFLLFSRDYPNSALACLERARENARTVREMISTDMWEQINAAYHFVLDASRTQRDAVYNNPYDFCRQLRTGSTLFGGLAHDTMTHGEALQFFRLGRLLERADKTSRVLDVKYFIILPDVDVVGTPQDDLQWSALLGSTSAMEAYRQRHGQIAARSVVDFLILDRRFPRAVLFCLIQADDALREITGTPPGTLSNGVERKLGRLCADLSYTRVEDIFARGLHEYVDDLQSGMNEVDVDIRGEYFSRELALAAQSQTYQ
jgi:uncharacterized alpha-E superfamily protein